MQQRVKFAVVVLQRRSGKQQQVVEGVLAQRHHKFRLGVLQSVRFVNHERAPVYLAEMRLIRRRRNINHLERGHDHVELVHLAPRVALEPGKRPGNGGVTVASRSRNSLVTATRRWARHGPVTAA